MSPKKPLDKKQRKRLSELVYTQGNLFGRDILFDLAKRKWPDDYPLRRAIQEWLKEQTYYQIYLRPVTKVKGSKPISADKPQQYLQINDHIQWRILASVDISIFLEQWMSIRENSTVYLFVIKLL